MAKKKITVKVRGSQFFEAEQCDVCIKNACILIHNGDPLFAYVMLPGEYAKFEHGVDGTVVLVDA